MPYLHKKIGCSTKPSAPLSIDDIQEAVNLKFGSGQYVIAEKGAWMSLANYHMTHFCHDISIEAEKAVDPFIKDHSNQLSTPGHISWYMNWLLTATSLRKEVQPSTPFMWQGLSADGMKQWVHSLLHKLAFECHSDPAIQKQVLKIGHIWDHKSDQMRTPNTSSKYTSGIRQGSRKKWPITVLGDGTWHCARVETNQRLSKGAPQFWVPVVKKGTAEVGHRISTSVEAYYRVV
ncbi:hypothetical protein EV421DRAFT_1742580 [Armillaria borealis]|uniref:Uncharacterized protein n=1 Tax=Armillaria borealis TaxID=47425 RepID=A0AA39IYS0_9AGAR|nr:hypothetical protein EV421DRAFT_1742580 [Armillaria borealis]